MQRRGWIAKTAGLLVLAVVLTGCFSTSTPTPPTPEPAPVPATPAKSVLPSADGATASVEFDEFILKVTADKSRYKVNEAPKVTAELQYLGDRDNLTFKHADPIIVVGVVKEASVTPYYFMDTGASETISHGWSHKTDAPSLKFDSGTGAYSFYAGTYFWVDGEMYKFNVQLPVVVE